MKLWILPIMILFFVAPALAEETEVVVVLEEEESKAFGLFSNANDIAKAKSSVSDSEELKTINAVTGKINKTDLEKLKRTKGVEKVIQNFQVSTVLQESTEIIGSTNVTNEYNITGKGKSICVIDSGLDLNNTYFSENFVAGHRFLGSERTDCTEDITACQDDNGHGTHVTGIIKGVNPQAGLVVVKTLDENGTGGTIDLLRGLDYCIDNAEEHNTSVISMSLGGSCSDGLCYTNYCDPYHSDFNAAFEAANNKNISVVVSTGNEMQTNKVGFPSCIEEAIRVGSSSKSDSMSYFTNRWGLDMILAPGQNINSTLPNNTFGSLSGTSMAAPHVSASLLLLADYYNTSNRTFLEDNLFESKVSIYDSGANKNYTRLDLQSSINNGNFTPTNNTNTTINESEADLQNVTIIPEEPEPAPTSGGGGGPSWDEFNEDKAGEDLPVSINEVQTPIAEDKGTLLSLVQSEPFNIKAWGTELWNKIKGWLIQ